MSRARYQLLSSNENHNQAEEEEEPLNSNNNNNNATIVSESEESEAARIIRSIDSSSISQPPTVIDHQTMHEICLEQEIVAQTPSSQQAVLQGAQTVASAPPSPAELPSYTEAVRLKKLEANTNDLPPAYFPPGSAGPTDSATRFAIDPSDMIQGLVDDSHNVYEQDVGSECMFLSAFMIAFFFNWIGFFASICLLPNAAGKYGALSGFGLSMAKWVTIVRYQEWMNYMNDFQQKLFFWLFIFLGFYLFFRGLINYMTLKYRPIASIDYTRRNRWFTFMD